MVVVVVVVAVVFRGERGKCLSRTKKPTTFSAYNIGNKEYFVLNKLRLIYAVTKIAMSVKKILKN